MVLPTAGFTAVACETFPKMSAKHTQAPTTCVGVGSDESDGLPNNSTAIQTTKNN
jgi:hypothetical protein